MRMSFHILLYSLIYLNARLKKILAIENSNRLKDFPFKHTNFLKKLFIFIFFSRLKK